MPSRRVTRAAGPPTARPVPAPPRPESGPITQAIPVVDQRDDEGVSGERGDRSSRRRSRRRRRRRELPQRAVVFVGPMAAGKTSLGKRVARELRIPFVDTDAVFVRRYGAITEFFATHGEAEFRRLEAEVIAKELAVEGARIVALGGGAVLHEETRRLLHQHPVVLLMTTQDAVLRTANLAKRPLLRDDPGAWGRILEERRPMYEEVADVTFRSDRATKEQLTRRATQWVSTQARGVLRRAQQQNRQGKGGRDT